MPFKFVYVCDLLEQLQSIRLQDPPLLAKDCEAKTCEAVKVWFQTHRRRIDLDTDGDALLSTLLPERRSDRVYSLREDRLQKTFARIHGLTIARRLDLERWKQPGAGDLADCIERVQRQGEMVTCGQTNEVTIELVQDVLLGIACHNKFSSPKVKDLAADRDLEDSYTQLGRLYRVLQAREAKWLTRLILKNYAPIIIPESTVYRSYHALLPACLKVQCEFPSALTLLESSLKALPVSVSNVHVKTETLQELKPFIGVKVGRPPFFKARSIKHCFDMAHGRRMSVETKYDGEYCQIHIDKSKPLRSQIQIFSKSGKDSTNDRIKLHKAIRDSLQLGDSQCKIQGQCILEGELVVYSDKDNRILDFHKIRKHVNRSGSFLGTLDDSQCHDYEHLMIVYFDILAIDDICMLNKPQHLRRQVLTDLIKEIPGRSQLAERQTISFSNAAAAKALRRLFARCISVGGEGMIVRPADEPYFNFDGLREYKSCCIKLKKEYIAGLGEVGDFAVIGASYDAVKAKEYGIPNIRWTKFYVACLENKMEVERWNARPSFVVVTTIEPPTRMLKMLIKHGDPQPVSFSENVVFELKIKQGIARGQKPTTIFTNPFVFDLSSFAFDKEGNTGFWTLRFPQVTKIHFDRTLRDTIGFQELQDMAEEHSSRIYDDDHSQQDLKWIEALRKSDPRGTAVDASTQGTISSTNTTPLKSPPLKSTEILQQSTSPLHSSVAGTTRKRKRTPLAEIDSQGGSQPSRVMQTPSSASHTSTLSRTAGVSENAKMASKSSGYNRIDVFDDGEDAVHARAGDDGTPKLLIMVPPSNLLGAASGSLIAQHQTTDGAIVVGKAHGSEAPYPTPPEESSPQPPMNKRSKAGHQALPAAPTNALPRTSTTDPPPPSAPIQAKTATDPISRSKPSCTIKPSACVFHLVSFCLSLCIAHFPWVTDDLLSLHGHTQQHFITDAQRWHDHTRFPLHCATTGRPTRKILLVDSNRKEATVAVMKAVRALELKRDSGGRGSGIYEEGDRKKDWVEAYHWALLEDLTRLEQRTGGAASSASASAVRAAWKRNFVGYV